MSSVGGLLGAVVSGRIPARLGVGRTLEVSVFSGAIFGLLAPLAQPATAFPLLIAAQFGFSFANPVYKVTQVSLRQSITPDRLQGRMNASMRFIVWGVMPLASLAGGAVASVIGVRGAVAVGAAGALLAVVPLVLTLVHRLREAPAPWQATEPPGSGQEGLGLSPGAIVDSSGRRIGPRHGISEHRASWKFCHRQRDHGGFDRAAEPDTEPGSCWPTDSTWTANQSSSAVDSPTRTSNT